MLIGLPKPQLTFGQHIIVNIIIRLVLIVYGEVQDCWSEVQYTDVDYKVVTDGARHVLQGESPYDRHTYRYSPLLAYLMVPNVIGHKFVGKLIFAAFDLLVGLLIRRIVLQEFLETFRENATAMQSQVKTRILTRSVDSLMLPEKYKDKAVLSALIWLYNPFSMVIGTRGNGDSIICFLVLVTLKLVLKARHGFTIYFTTGLIHGLAIHYRVYPIIFSVSYYLFAAGPDKQGIFSSIFLPNRKQIGLVFGTLCSLAGLTAIFHSLYGFEFIYETYLYHFIRKDTRHNFSLYFYMQYLNADQTVSPILKLITALPQFIIIGAVTLLFSRNRKTLPFAIFLITFTLVTFNSVLTSHYFVWFMAVFPVCFANFARFSPRSSLSYGMMWILSQGIWLLSAYFLEFKGWNTFNLIWLHGCVFFAANMLVVHRMIGTFGVVAKFKSM